MTRPVRTRFAPSPTGHLHIGGARTALFAWAFARRHQGQFILRIEDTDVARSEQEKVDGILQGMKWLGLDYDEGPFYQMQRMPRYREVIQQMLAAGTAYHCYTSPEELDRIREEQRARSEKPRYDGRWRPEPDKTLPIPPEGIQPVVRFKNPQTGVVAWNDHVKGRVEFANAELDDLIIARPDGTPTYNFCVVVDDWDMRITHVIRGDDHVNNTPRQINILKALGAELPEYAHLSMILGDDGQKLSKRHGAVSVMEYEEQGFLPEAVINYLARLGWSHGDDEIFSREQLVNWFDLDHITPSAAQFNTQKLLWLNAHYIKETPAEKLAGRIAGQLSSTAATAAPSPTFPASLAALTAICELYKARAQTLNDLVAAAATIQNPAPPAPSDEDRNKFLDEIGRKALSVFDERCAGIAWNTADINTLIKSIVAELGIKMPQLAMPIRLALTGVTQTPSVDALLALLTPDEVKARIAHLLKL